MHVLSVSALIDSPALFIQNFSNQEYKASCQNWGMAAGNDGLLYVANNSGLLVFDGNAWMTYETPDQAVTESVIIHKDTVFTGHYNDFGYWLADNKGFYTYYSLLKLFPSIKLRNETFRTLYSDEDVLWIKSENYCFQYQNGRLTDFPLPAKNGFTHLLRDGKSFYLFIEGKGVFAITDEEFLLLPSFSPLKDKKLVFIHQIADSSYIVGTENEGVFRVTKETCLPWNTPVNKELKRACISSLEIVDGKYLIGTHYGGLYITRDDGNFYEHYTLNHQLQDNNIHAIYKQDGSKIWLALDNGISLLTFSSPVTLLEERSKIGKLEDGLLVDGMVIVRTNQGIFRQVIQPDGGLMMEPYNDSTLFVQETKIPKILASLSPEIADTILPFRDTFMENDEIIWGLQGNKKIFRLRLSNLSKKIETVKSYIIPFSDGETAITDICLIDGFVVVFTEKGCWRYDRISDSFISYEQLEKQSDICSQGKMSFPVGNDLYWIISGNEAALFHIKEGPVQLKCRVLFDNYNLNLVNREKRIIPLSDSLHLISTMQGILLINTRELIESHLHTNTAFRIRRIQYTDDKGVHYLPVNSTKIVLPHDFRNLKINVGTSIFTPTHQISYRIKGNSSAWSEWQKGGEISFFQLPVGKYELAVRRYVVKGPFPEILLKIEIETPWYNTVWAYIVYLFILWGIVHGGLHYYLKYQRKQERLRLEAEHVAEQQRLQRMRNEMLETELQNKNNELTLQTSALVKRNQVMQSLRDELEIQKQTLGDRYPNKLYTRMKSLIEENINNQADWVLFESYFNSAHQNFIDRLRARYPDLTTGDFRICCLLRMNLSTKEIASLLNISIRSVELRRYRLRKRLALDSEANLVDFLSSF